MLTSFCFPTALPTECIIKLLGVCQSDRWKWCLKIVWLAFLWFWVRLSNFFIYLGANSISFVVASLLYFAHILWGSWPFSWQIYLKFIHIKEIISLGYEPRTVFSCHLAFDLAYGMLWHEKVSNFYVVGEGIKEGLLYIIDLDNFIFWHLDIWQICTFSWFSLWSIKVWTLLTFAPSDPVSPLPLFKTIFFKNVIVVKSR